MGEQSLPWGSTAPGDAGPYSDNNWSDIWRKLFIRDRTAEGVLIAYGNELAVTGVASPIGVATGAALVDGKFYENDAALAVAIPLPAVATRYDRIVLRKSWAAQTVRVVRIGGMEGAGVPPALTQVDGVTWDITLATLSITILGVIVITDARQFVGSPLAALFGPAGANRTITVGVITVDRRTFYRVDTEGGAASDELDTISGGYDGQVIILAIVNVARVVQLTTAGNLILAAPVTLTKTSTLVILRFRTGTGWEMVGGTGGADVLAVQVFS